MALAEELLDNISEEQAAEYALSELKPHIVVDEDRNIILPERYKKIASQGDHNMETYTFDCPRFSDGRDMSEMVVYINYIRSDGKTGSYPADNVSIDAQNTDLMHFDWTLLLPATFAEGVLAFLVCVCRTGNDGKIENHWSSRMCREAMITEGMDCHKDTIVDLYPDIITRILERLNVLEDGGTNSVQYTIQDLEEEQKAQARKNIGAAAVAEVSKLSEDIATKASAIKEKASGEVIVVTDSDEAKPLGLSIDGKSTQDGEPTPDNPIEIRNIGVYDEASGKYAVEVKCTGKNKLKIIGLTTSKAGVDWEVTDDNHVIASGTPTAYSDISIVSQIEIPRIDTYTLSFSGVFEGCLLGLRLLTKDGTVVKDIFENDNAITVDLSSYENVKKWTIYIKRRTDNEVVKADGYLQLERGSVATEYEPYKETTATVLLDEPLCGLPVSSGGNYTDSNGQQWLADEIVKYADGSGERIQRTELKVYDGSDDEQWADRTEAYTNKKEGQYRYISYSAPSYKRGFSLDNYIANYGVAESINSTVAPSENGISTYGHNTEEARYLYFTCYNIHSLEELKTTLSQVPLVVVVELEEPIRTPLTAEQIAEIEKLSMFYPTTILSNDCNANMEVTYIADTKAYIDKKFAELATAMV